MRNIFTAIIKKSLLNWRHPKYSKSLFAFCSKYVDFCYGDYNFDRNTNGENKIVRTIIGDETTVFDVGANDGEYSKYILSVKPRTKIHAFEPGEQAFRILNRLPLNANNIALGNKKEIKTLYSDKNKSTHNSLYDLDKEQGISTLVAVETLDDYCREKNIKHIDFLKIDVEGYEFFVLEGAKQMFEAGNIDYVQFEFSGATIQSRVFLKDFIDFFNKYDYDLYRIKPLSIEKVIYSPAKERFTLTNYLAIKKSADILKRLNTIDHDF